MKMEEPMRYLLAALALAFGCSEGPEPNHCPNTEPMWSGHRAVVDGVEFTGDGGVWMGLTLLSDCQESDVAGDYEAVMYSCVVGADLDEHPLAIGTKAAVAFSCYDEPMDWKWGVVD